MINTLRVCFKSTNQKFNSFYVNKNKSNKNIYEYGTKKMSKVITLAFGIILCVISLNLSASEQAMDQEKSKQATEAKLELILLNQGLKQISSEEPQIIIEAAICVPYPQCKIHRGVQNSVLA